MAYVGITSYLDHPHPGGAVLARSIGDLSIALFSFLLCFQRNPRRDGGRWTWSMILAGVFAGGALMIELADRRQGLWSFFALLGLLCLVLVVMSAKGRWRQDDAKASPPA